MEHDFPTRDIYWQGKCENGEFDFHKSLYIRWMKENYSNYIARTERVYRYLHVLVEKAWETPIE